MPDLNGNTLTVKINKMKTNEIQTITPEKHNGEVSPTHLIEMAISQHANVEQLEKLMELQLKWDANKARKQFFEALSAFQNDMPVVTKNKTVDYTGKTGIRTKYSYATLDNIIAEIKSHLNKHGLAYRWEFDDSSKIEVRCIITHVAGHSEVTIMSSSVDNSPGKNDIQSRGSALTYLQRYTLIGALGIGTAQDDTDAIDAKPAPPKQAIVKDRNVLITDFKDYDTLMAWAIIHPAYNDPAFQEKLSKQIELIKGGQI